MEDKKPVFYSTATSFTVILKNVNYQPEKENHQENHQENIFEQILRFCENPRSKREIASHMGFRDLQNFTLRYLKPLVDSGKIRMTNPENPRHRNQKYVKNDSKAGN